MRRYWTLVICLLVFFLALYGVVEALQIPMLAESRLALEDRTAAVAALGVGLLAADALLPVPSSLVMVAHGALFGFGMGALLSLVGRVGFAAFGFAIGRRGGSLLDRLVTPAERVRSDALLARWGPLAIVFSRPVPLVAETTMILAGASTMTWRAALVAAVLGSAPEAILYALTGAIAASFQNAALVFVSVLGVASVFWIVLRRAESRLRPAGDPGVAT